MFIVECVNTRQSVPSQIIEGERYYLDINTAHGDTDGEWYADIYDYGNKNQKIGHLKMSHFMRVE